MVSAEDANRHKTTRSRTVAKLQTGLASGGAVAVLCHRRNGEIPQNSDDPRSIVEHDPTIGCPRSPVWPGRRPGAAPGPQGIRPGCHVVRLSRCGAGAPGRRIRRPSLIQRKELTELHRCSIFYLEECRGPGSGRSPVVVRAGYSHVLPSTPVEADVAGPCFGSGDQRLRGGAEHSSHKRLDFKKQTIILASASAVSGVVAFVLALRGYGVWSLVAQQIVQSVVNTVLLWLLGGWRPQLLFSLGALREMFTSAGECSAPPC